MQINKWKNKSLVWVIHIIVWAAIFAMPYIFNHDNEGDKHSHDFRSLDTATNFLWMGLFYLNALLLIPRLFYRKRFIFYSLALVLSFAIIMFLHGLIAVSFANFSHFRILPSSLHNLTPFLFTVFMSTAYKIIHDKFKADANTAALQKENLKTELSFLRSQISPHFLFNVLNNIVAMVRLKSEELEPTVIKLSSLLQYMLYESNDEKVLLKNEIDSLQDYIDLQKLRFSTNLQLDTKFLVTENWHAIEPMLLIPFVENAFKHGNVFGEAPEILIKLEVVDNVLDFYVRNKYTASDRAKDKTSGIGLTNVKRRLELLYPERHTLEITDTDGHYNVHLKLLLQ